MDFNIGLFELLLLVSALVAMLVRRLHMPYSVGLVMAGISFSFLASSSFPDIPLTKDFIYDVLLPPLIFEAAFHMRWGQVRRDFVVVQTLAVLGVLLSAGVTAAGMHFLLHWEWISGLLFGTLIAATDPVSILATFKEAGVTGRFRHLMEAESLFNDGTAAAAFRVTLAFVAGTHVGLVEVLKISGVVLLGSVFCGLLIGNAVLSLLHRTDDHLVEITFAMIAAYGSFLLAENLHLSGVLATLIAGLAMGKRNTSDAMTKRGREAVEVVLEYTVFAANSFIFLFIGVQQARREYDTVWLSIGIAIMVVMLGRAVAVYPCCMLFSRSSLQIEVRHQHILFWGGLRGALALALAMGLPPGLPRREEIITVCFAVVAFSIFVQGATMTPLLRRLGVV
ncbi:CPA1 family monovalent cation:H+ antiporter [Paraburkholderia sp. HC6.4b]|uniref:cation:proton antiporter n=1 Tax=unclassified Paraburkholderia TaxID=2615204 RepID=UPI001610AA00|nr:MULTISPECIES: sodium:proton antiporter [unclassified Paraburkholderia]MBB5413567.1 CPA1 family monovalent cation:H+ antiporter [Paraburkholderia sp. HC6.4b]MBB5455940.1 CPA1 family monovalent cation:H+ antiporter [Paraburkholderia sp. Kb1A]